MKIRAKVIDRNTQLPLPKYEMILSYYKYLPGSMYGKVKEYQIEYIETDSIGNFEYSFSVAKDKDVYRIQDTTWKIIFESNMNGDLDNLYAN